MDQKTWLWRKRSSEKTIVSNGEEEKSPPRLSEKEIYLEESLKSLNEKLASVIDDCSARDKLAQYHQKMAEEAVADKQRAEEEIKSLKQELDEVQKQKRSADERLDYLTSAKKDCMEQLNQLRQEQDERVRDALAKESVEFEKSRKELEEKLSETSKRLADSTIESSYLGKALLMKEKLIEDLKNRKSRTEAEFEALMKRLDSIEKENAFLRYEFRSIEKELELRNEELEYSRRSAESSQKQHLENVKKIKKLESECQRLRALTRKRIPYPSMLANVKSDFEIQGRDHIDSSRRKKGVNVGARDSRIQCFPEDLDKKASFFADLENENKILRECLVKKEEEVFYLLRKFENSSRLDQTESNPASDEVSCTSGYETVESNALSSVKDNDKLSAEGKCKMIGASEMSLMDDFVEMEKLAIVATDASEMSPTLSDSSMRALVPFGQNNDKKLAETKDPSEWLQEVKNLIMEQQKVSKRSLNEIVVEIKTALYGMESVEPSELLPISGHITWKSPTRAEPIDEDINQSITKVIELASKFDGLSWSDDNRIHVFRWESSELITALQKFTSSCSSLLDGRIGFERFAADLALALGWIISNCVPYQDHSTVREEFRKHLGGDGPGTALELESVRNLMSEIEKIYSVSQVEVAGLKNELNARSLEYESLMDKLQQSEQRITSLKEELEILTESKRMVQDQIDNQKLMNEDLDTQLTATKGKLNKVMQKLSSLQVELDSKRHFCEELEGTCLELQLQLESSSTRNKHSDDYENQEDLLRTGMEITKASAKLAECEKTILNLGNQLKAMGSAKELSVLDKVLSITNNNSNKMFKPQRSSLRDHILSEDNGEEEKLQSPKTKEIISMSKTNMPSSFQGDACNHFSFPDSHMTNPKAYQSLRIDSKNRNTGALIIVPRKKRSGIGFLRKLLVRRTKASSFYYGK